MPLICRVVSDLTYVTKVVAMLFLEHTLSESLKSKTLTFIPAPTQCGRRIVWQDPLTDNGLTCK